MSIVRIAAIVGGHGEVEAVPILIRRIAYEVDPTIVTDVRRPIRIPEGRLKKPGELERAVELAARSLEGQGGVFVLMDCDWDNSCPKVDAPPLLDRAISTHPNLPIVLVLANKEYESWFVCASESLRESHRLSQELEIVADPEAIRGAKEWLTRHMPRNQPYSETIDQPSFTALFDMQAARRANSFDKCYRDISKLISTVSEIADQNL
jgi:hypothetical protein